MQRCDTMISSRYVAPVVPAGTCLEDHSLVIHGGEIVALLPTEEAQATYSASRHVERPHHLLTPGFINAHGHAPMVLLRGFADDLPLGPWLEQHIWPAEAKWVGEDFVRVGTELAVLEMLSSGTTCFADMYFFPEVVAEVARNAGMRAAVGLILVDFPSAWASTPEEYLSAGLAVLEQFRDVPLIHPQWTPHSPYAVGDESFSRLLEQATQTGLRIHLHVSETEQEVKQSFSSYGMSPLKRLQELGFVHERLTVAHFVHPREDDIQRLAESGAAVVHCPESNAKLASGIAPVEEILEAGIPVGLGTDGAASNNNLDMIEEMRTAALLSKLRQRSAASLGAHRCLELATLGGARSLGLADRLGSLEVGKIADLACIDLLEPRTWPVYDPVAQLVYAASGQQVTDTWVQGEHLYEDGRHKSIDRHDVLQRAGRFQRDIAAGR